MKTIKPLCAFLLMTAVSLSSSVAWGDASVTDAFASLYALLGVTNVTQSAFLDNVADGSEYWYSIFSSARANISEQSMRNWFCSLTAASVPTNTPYSDRDALLRSKAFAVCQIGTNETAVCGDTNCWLAVAMECGRIRGALHTADELDAIRGVVSRHTDSNGVDFVSVADISHDVIWQRFVRANDIEQNDALFNDYVSNVKAVFPVFFSSSFAGELSYAERNALVSNIVEAARFTPAEAAALGLTNVTHQASE